MVPIIYNPTMHTGSFSREVQASLGSLGFFIIGLLLLRVLTGHVFELVAIVDIELLVVVDLQVVALVVRHLVNVDHADLIHHDFAIDLALGEDVDLVLVLGRRLWLFEIVQALVVKIVKVWLLELSILALIIGAHLVSVHDSFYASNRRLLLFLGCRDLAQLALKRVNRSRVTCEHLEEALHVDDHLVIEDVFIVHGMGSRSFKLPLNILLDLLAALVLSLTVAAQDGIDSLLNRLLVAILANLHNLPHHDVLQLVLEQIDLLAMLDDLLVGHQLLLELL